MPYRKWSNFPIYHRWLRVAWTRAKQAFPGKPCSEKFKKKKTFHAVNYDGLSLQIRQFSSWKVKEVALEKDQPFSPKKGNFFHCKLLPLVFVVCLFCLCSIRHATKICFVKVLSHFFFQTSFLRALYCFSFCIHKMS